MTEAIIVTKKRWRMSPIWFLPFTALLLALWLGYETYMHGGVSVTIRFTTGSGISVNKTKVMYKGIAIGKVTDVEIDKKNIEQVIVTILLDKRTEPYLLTDTQFWLVQPSVSLGGISGLDTLVSGNYIAMSPGTKGKNKLEFIALDNAPIISGGSGLFLKIEAETAGSVVSSSPIYFKEIKVGEVLGSQYNKNNNNVSILIKIKPEYAYLVKKQSRFYNVSGIEVSGGLNGIKIKSGSLASIVIGGLAFYNPENTYLNEAAVNGDKFPLFEDFESADIGLPILLKLDKADGLEKEMTDIKYLGSKIGFIKDIRVDYETGKVSANAYVDPQAASLLTTASKIWRVDPVLSINRVTGIETLISGVYLAIRPGKGEPSSVFNVLNKPPPYEMTKPGLHISLSTKRFGSLQIGSGIYYKNIEVGKIQSYQLTDANNNLSIQLFIKPEYAKYITSRSHFYKNSGISIKGGISGLSIKAESLSSIISGGISVYTSDLPDTKLKTKLKAKQAQNGDEFILYDSYEKATSDSEIAIYFADVSGIKKDFTHIVYKGIDLGYVSKMIPDKKINKIKVVVKINTKAKELLKKGTLFWLVKPQVSLAGIKGIETIVAGNYISLKPGRGRYSKVFTALEEAPEIILPADGLDVIVKMRELGSISVGAPVLYHQLSVGIVSSYQLDKKAENILVKLHIHSKYQNLVKKHSRFYQASGFTVNLKLTELDFRSESMASLLKGGIGFINPKIKRKTLLAKQNQMFYLYSGLESAKQNRFSIRIAFPNAESLSQGAKVKFNGVIVGEVDDLELHTDLKQVIANVSIDNHLKKILGKDSRFMLAKAEFGLANTQHLGTLISGSFIILEPVAGKFSSYFKAQEMKASQGLNLWLSTEQLGSIKKNNPVYYRQVQVGKVLDYKLSDTANKVLIYILIEQQYRSLVRKNSKFWNASGINLEINLFAGSKVKTESLQSILDGGISFATPGGSSSESTNLETDSLEIDEENNDVLIQKSRKTTHGLAKKASQDSLFVLHKEVQDNWLQWNPKISLGSK